MCTVPLVDVAYCAIVAITSARTVWAPAVVNGTATILFHYLWQELLVNVSRGKARREPVFWVVIVLIVSQLSGDGFHVLIVFIISRIYDNACVVSQPLDVVDCFFSNAFPELSDLGWIVTAGKGEVLPDEDAKIVAGFVED